MPHYFLELVSGKFPPFLFSQAYHIILILNKLSSSTLTDWFMVDLFNNCMASSLLKNIWGPSGENKSVIVNGASCPLEAQSGKRRVGEWVGGCGAVFVFRSIKGLPRCGRAGQITLAWNAVVEVLPEKEASELDEVPGPLAHQAVLQCSHKRCNLFKILFTH